MAPPPRRWCGVVVGCFPPPCGVVWFGVGSAWVVPPFPSCDVVWVWVCLWWLTPACLGLLGVFGKESSGRLKVLEPPYGRSAHSHRDLVCVSGTGGGGGKANREPGSEMVSRRVCTPPWYPTQLYTRNPREGHFCLNGANSRRDVPPEPGILVNVVTF